MARGAMMAGNTDFDPIEANASRDPAIVLMATVFAKPDLYIAAGDAGFRLGHLRHLPSRCTEIMRRFAEAFGRTDDWEAVAIEFRQRDPGFFRWLDARATAVGAEHVNELVADVIAAANGSPNGNTGPLSNGGSAGTAYTSSDKPLPSKLTRWTTLTYVDAAGVMCTTMASDNAKIEHFPSTRPIDPETGLAEPEPTIEDKRLPGGEPPSDDDGIADPAARRVIAATLAEMRNAGHNELAMLEALYQGAILIEPFNDPAAEDILDAAARKLLRPFFMIPGADDPESSLSETINRTIGRGLFEARERRSKRDENRSRGTHRQDGDQKAHTDARDRKRGQDKPGAWRDNLIDPQKLCDERFPEVKHVIPGLFPEGVTLLASRPKLCKSWLVLQITTAVANGTVTLVASDQPVHGDVLYLALEDTARRLQRRLTKYFGAQRETWPARLKLSTTWRRLDQGGIDDLREWCKSIDKPTLISIDTLKKVRKPKGKNQSDYDADYEACEGLMGLAKEFPGLSIIVAHHDRKMAADDVFDTVSGTLGLTGGVDTIAVMKGKEGRPDTLHIEGRDLLDSVKKAINFDRETCRIMILGEAADVQQSDERARVLVALADLPDGLAVPEIQAAAQIGTRGAAYMLLSRMVQDGDIYRVGRGRYSLTRPLAAEDTSEKREIVRPDVQYGETAVKRHSAPSATQSNASNADPVSDHADALEFLRWALTPGPRLLRDIEISARAEGLLGKRQPIRNDKSFQLAREALGIVVEREGFGAGSKVYWRLPDDEARRDAGSQITREPEDDQ